MQLIPIADDSDRDFSFMSEDRLLYYQELQERHAARMDERRLNNKGARKVRVHKKREKAVQAFWRIRICNGSSPMTWLVNCKATNAMIEKERILAVERWPALAEMYPERVVKVVVGLEKVR